MKKLLIVTALLALAAAPGHAAEKTYHFGVSDQRTNVTFESTTDFEVVLGSTHELFGVKIPEMAAAKVNDTWDVQVVAFASTAPPTAAGM